MFCIFTQTIVVCDRTQKCTYNAHILVTFNFSRKVDVNARRFVKVRLNASIVSIAQVPCFAVHI